MFNNNKKQYINILQQNKQLKINYKIVQDDKILKEEQSSFLLSDTKLPNDAKFKINALQKDINHTYISSLFENNNQNIVSTNDVDIISYDSIKIGNKHSIIIPKNEVNSVSRYYEDTGIDFILSPYTIIEEYLDDNGKKNSLNFFIYNNIIYTIILNNQNELAFNKIKVLTPFESTQDETFLEDDIVGQKLYEEVNFLEIQQFLNETVEEYYTSADNVEFLEHIQMLYTLKPMSDEQIKSLQDVLMIPISYKAIPIDTYMDEIIQREDSKSHNFINTRVKKEDKNIYFWIVLALLSIGVAAGIFNFQLDNKEMEQKVIKKTINKEIVKVKKQKEIQSVAPSTISLPSHKQANTNTLQNIKMLFDVLPYDSVLKDIEINKNSSTYVSNFIVTSNSISDMQAKLKNIYANSKVLLKHQNKVILNTIIQNNTLLEKYNDSSTIQNIEYKRYNFLSTSKATSYLKGLGIKNSIIKFDSKEKDKYLIYNFSITSKVQSPQEFFDFIKKLNSQNLSMKINYPITFSRTTNSLEVKYKVQINQQNKKQVSLKK